MKVKLRPFSTPKFVLLETRPSPRENGFYHAHSYPLAAVPPEDLSGLCDGFRKAVFEKAGKPDPENNDLLAMCKEALQREEDAGESAGSRDFIERLRAAIAKAEGKEAQS